jgi:hypothetical protein
VASMRPEDRFPRLAKVPRFILAGAGIVFVVSAREVLIRSGTVYGSENVHLVTVVAAGLVLGIAGTLYGQVTKAAAVVGAGTAALAALQLVPYTPSIATAAACPGAQVYGVAFLGTSHPIGVNARAGPGRSFEQTARFQGDCSVGFEGFCLGEPVLDQFIVEKYQVPDVRWYELPDSRGYISAAVIEAQSPTSEIRAQPHCPGAFPPPLLDRVTLESAQDAPEVVAHGTSMHSVGFSALVEGEPGPLFFRLGLDASSEDGFRTAVAPSPAFPPGVTDIVAAAVACHGPEVPSDEMLFGRLHLAGLDGSRSVLTQTSNHELGLSPSSQSRLVQTACLLPD